MKRFRSTKALLTCLVLAGLAAPACGELVEIDHDFSRAGVDLSLKESYNDDYSERESILLVHGLTYSSHEFDVDYLDYSLESFLVQNGFSVWLLDIAGYGQSDLVEDGFSVDSQYASEDIVAALEHIRGSSGDDKVDVLGWSWGTVTASLAAAKKPEYVESLVLYAPITRAFDGEAPTEPWHQNTWQHASSDFQMNENGEIDPEITDPAVAAIFLSNAWKADGASSPNGGRVDLLQGEETVLIDLASLRNPTLLIGGNKDPYVSWGAVESDLAGLAPGHGLVLEVFDGASHILLLEKPFYKRFQREVLSFLRQTPSRN